MFNHFKLHNYNKFLIFDIGLQQFITTQLKVQLMTLISNFMSSL
jgi:hypothetical protein